MRPEHRSDRDKNQVFCRTRCDLRLDDSANEDDEKILMKVASGASGLTGSRTTMAPGP